MEAIIHCASFGMSGTDNLPAHNDTIEKINLGGTRNVLKAASKSKVKAIGEKLSQVQLNKKTIQQCPNSAFSVHKHG